MRTNTTIIPAEPGYHAVRKPENIDVPRWYGHFELIPVIAWRVHEDGTTEPVCPGVTPLIEYGFAGIALPDEGLDIELRQVVDEYSPYCVRLGQLHTLFGDEQLEEAA